ncbi:hypothetical protein Naga_101636g2 [Nannochloropsis gaditana]|uniref:Uncharacterized protein n=1 Tax=Nannochloropsis gaditana TaxID=72520 RepID=W7TIZ3_9STRA|nr:hypothetical protein Naga_101636g2 [Nannochloropsis gaditana]
MLKSTFLHVRQLIRSSKCLLYICLKVCRRFVCSQHIKGKRAKAMNMWRVFKAGNNKKVDARQGRGHDHSETLPKYMFYQFLWRKLAKSLSTTKRKSGQ